jgi:hypothetical protein
VAGGLNCYFGCMGGFSEWGLSLDCRFIRGVRYDLYGRALPCSYTHTPLWVLSGEWILRSFHNVN